MVVLKTKVSVYCAVTKGKKTKLKKYLAVGTMVVSLLNSCLICCIRYNNFLEYTNYNMLYRVVVVDQALTMCKYKLVTLITSKQILV